MKMEALNIYATTGSQYKNKKSIFQVQYFLEKQCSALN